MTISLYLVLFVVFLDWMGLGLVYPMFSSMLFHLESPFLPPEASKSLRGLYLGILLATMSIAQFFSGPILGALSDSRGRKPLLLLSLALGVVGYTVCVLGILLKSIAILILARVLVGISAGNASVVSAVVVDLSSIENKPKHFGLYSMAAGIGFAIGPFLGGQLSDFGFAIPFIVSGAAVLTNMILIFWFFQETHKVRKTAFIRFDDGLRKLKKSFQLTGFKGLFATVFVLCFGWSFFYEFIPVTWITNYGFHAGSIGVFFAYGAAWYALSSGLLIRPIVNRYNPLSILFYSLSLLGVIILILLTPLKSEWIFVYLPPVNFLFALIYPTYYTVTSNGTSNEAQGEIMGVLQSIQSAAFALSPLAAGFFLGISSAMPMWIGGISMLLAALILGISFRKKIFSAYF